MTDSRPFNLTSPAATSLISNGVWSLSSIRLEATIEGTDMLKMKSECESCKAKLQSAEIAFICSYECTFCPDCTESLDHICPNCDGELIRRPKRTKAVAEVAITQIKRKIFGS